jgi:hypothetical protein
MDTEIISDRKPKVSKSSGIVLPTGVWTLKQAHAINPLVSRGSVYNRVKFLVKDNQLAVVGVVRKGRGKPAWQYSKIERVQAVAPQQAETPEPVSDLPF